MATRLNALILEPDHKAGLKLKAAAYNSGKFESIPHCRTLAEALSQIENMRGELDLVFISQRFPEDRVEKFLAALRALPGGQDSACIFVLGPEHQDMLLAVRGVLSGADGFLVEPFSVNDLEQAITAAKGIKDHRRITRRAALELLVDDSIVYLDEISRTKLEGRPAGERLKYFREIGKVLFKLSESNLDSYYEIAIKKFTSAGPPRAVWGEAVEREGIGSLVAPKEESVSNESLDEAVVRMKNRLIADGIDPWFLEEAVKRIRQRMNCQGIEAGFSDALDSEEIITRRREGVVRFLKARLAEAGVNAEILLKGRK